MASEFSWSLELIRDKWTELNRSDLNPLLPKDLLKYSQEIKGNEVEKQIMKAIKGLPIATIGNTSTAWNPLTQSFY